MKVQDKPKALRKRSRKERGERTRAALLDATLRMIAQYGYRGASVSRITNAAGTGQGTLYSYFGSHQNLLDEALPAEGLCLLEELHEKVKGSENYFDHERRAFAAVLDFLRRRPRFLRVLSEAEVASPHSYARHMQNIEGRYLTALEKAHKSGEIPARSKRELKVLAQIFAGVREYVAQHILYRSGPNAANRRDLERMAIEVYLKFIRHGLNEPVPKIVHRAPKRPVRDELPEDVRVRLLECAAREIHAVGYLNMTIKTITERADVATGTFYNYFSSRQSFLEELLTHARTQLMEHAADATIGSRSIAETEIRGFQGFFELIAQKPWLLRVVTEASVWAPEAYRKHLFIVADGYLRVLRRAKAAGSLAAFEDEELVVLSPIFMAARHYLAARHILPRSAPGMLPKWIVETYAALVCEGLSSGVESAVSVRPRVTS